MNLDEKSELLTEMMQALRAADKAYSLEGPMMLTVQLTDGTYRNGELMGTDFFPVGVRCSSKNANFIFEPEEICSHKGQEIKAVEVKSTKLDETFALLLSDAQEWALKRYIDGGASRAKTIEGCTTFDGLIGVIVACESEDLKKEAEADDTAMIENPIFGMF